MVSIGSKHILKSPKDKDQIQKKGGIIYWYKNQEMDCNDECIRESSRTSTEGFKEHLKAPSPYGYQTTTSHPATLNNFSIVGREWHYFARPIKESIFIRENSPTLNKKIGKYKLLHIWDGVLNNTKDHKIGKQQELQHQVCRTS